MTSEPRPARPSHLPHSDKLTAYIEARAPRSPQPSLTSGILILQSTRLSGIHKIQTRYSQGESSFNHTSPRAKWSTILLCSDVAHDVHQLPSRIFSTPRRPFWMQRRLHQACTPVLELKPADQHPNELATDSRLSGQVFSFNRLVVQLGFPALDFDSVTLRAEEKSRERMGSTSALPLVVYVRPRVLCTFVHPRSRIYHDQEPELRRLSCLQQDECRVILE